MHIARGVPKWGKAADADIFYKRFLLYPFQGNRQFSNYKG